MSKDGIQPQKSNKLVSREVIIFIVLTLTSFFFFARFLNLTPKVDKNIFFSNDDPHFQSEHQINRLFIRQDSQLIISATGKIDSPEYVQKVSDLSEMLLAAEGVTSVNSLTHFGPVDLKDAIQSPLWKRLIVSNDKKSSNLILLLDDKDSSAIVSKVEKIIDIFQADDFQLKAAGMPYVIELIKRNLIRDLKIFSLIAFFIFGFLIFQIFHSKSVLLGTMLSCLNACIWTLMLATLFGVPMGLLTANLGTIVFVMTLSHIIFLTYNWRKLCAAGEEKSPVAKAVKLTFPPSFWSMFTTLVGFASLMFVQAKPLRDLGLSGALGAIVSIAVAYGFFPAFLRMASLRQNKKSRIEDYEHKTYKLINFEKRTVAFTIFIICLVTLPGLFLADSDPSLLQYFSKKSEIAKGLKYIDQNGGSSPLIVVVRLKGNEKLNSGDAYQKLWNLQSALEQHRSVGSVISLPVLIAQAKDSRFGWIMSKEFLLNALTSEKHDKIARSFVTEDRKYGLFLLRMIESYRTMPRGPIVEEIKGIAKIEGFHPAIIGGVYNLQGRLAELVATSLIFGLGKLLMIFFFVVWFISKSAKVAFSITASITIIPLTVIGTFGIYHIPLDIISAPASNVAIAMGIDSMIHMVNTFKRTKDWQKVRDELWQPILTSMFVVSIGFAIFLFSTFPPTQRFGAAIMFGTILSSLTALFIMPLIFENVRFKEWWGFIAQHVKK